MAIIAGIDILQLPPYLPVPDVTRYFGLGKKKVWLLLKQKRIRGSKPGKTWLVNTASILKELKRTDNIKTQEAE